MDKGKAVTAAAHKLARLIYAMLSKGEEYTDAARTTSKSATASACCATSQSRPGSSACRSFPRINPAENTIADQLLGRCFLRGVTLVE